MQTPISQLLAALNKARIEENDLHLQASIAKGSNRLWSAYQSALAASADAERALILYQPTTGYYLRDGRLFIAGPFQTRRELVPVYWDTLNLGIYSRLFAIKYEHDPTNAKTYHTEIQITDDEIEAAI